MGDIHLRRMQSIFERMHITSLVHMCQRNSTNWCSIEKESTYWKNCRSVLHSKNVPERFWFEAMKIIAHGANELPQPMLGFISPFETIWNMKPTVSYFQVFCCIFYVFMPSHLCSKFDNKAIMCIFIGYNNQIKGWTYCDLIVGRCNSLRYVVFDETSYWLSLGKKV